MGDGSKGYRGGPASLARFSESMAVAAASDGGAVYVSDYGNFRVRQLCNGIVSTLAGAGSLRVGPSVAIGAIGAPVGMYLDDRRGLLYTTSLARGARSVLAITVLNDGQRRAIRLFPIIRTWALVQRQRAVLPALPAAGDCCNQDRRFYGALSLITNAPIGVLALIVRYIE